MLKCYICDCDINKNNETEEHIFLNSIGGNLKSKKLLCATCNSTFGEDIDSELSKQFNYFSNMLNIERDRGKPQPFKVTGKESGDIYSYEPGGKPKMLKPEIKKNKNQYEIVARDKKQAKEILKGLKRKHEEINIDEVLKEAKKTKEYINNVLSFNISLGGEKVFRALCKIAVSFYLYKGGKRKQIEKTIGYLKGITETKVVSPTYFEDNPIKKEDDDILHSVIVVGSKSEKLLYSYIEIFNFYKVAILLNEDYLGEDIEYSYFFDVLSRKEVQREYELSISNLKMKNILKGIYFENDRLTSEIEILMKKIKYKQEDDHRKKLIDTAFERVRKNYSGEETITEEMITELTNEIMKEITPYVENRLK